MFNVNALLASLHIMAKGMAGILIVTSIIVLTITILNKVGNR